MLHEEISRHIHTPAYVFNVDEFERRAKKVKQTFGESIGICYSIKANPFLLKFLPDTFDKIEVCSPGELTICEKTGVDMQKVVFSGVNKTKADVERAAKDQVGVFTAESRLHADLINQVAVEKGICVPVLLRLTAGSQFGMDEADVLDIIEHRSEYPGFVIVGIHYFSGTQKRKATVIEKELHHLMEFFDKVEAEHDFRLERLEYGTGLAVDYFAADAQEQEMARLEAVSGELKKVAEKVQLTVEMGRFFAASCGSYYASVMDTKTNQGVHYAILDGGLHQLKYDGQIQGMQIPPIFQVKANPASTETQQDKWTLCGSLCTTADVLARNVELDNLQIGDVLAFEKVGAYSVSEGMAAFLSRDMPEVYAYSQACGLRLLRERILTDSLNTP